MSPKWVAPETEDWDGFLKELQSENDRAAAILGGTFVDEYLGQLLSNFFVDNRKAVAALVFDLYGPILSFAARTNVAYCLGLISAAERDDLDTVRFIRNQFAHKLHGRTFDTPEIASKCTALTRRAFMPPGWLRSPRETYIHAVVMLAQQLAVRALDPKNQHRPVAPDFTHGEWITAPPETGELRSE